MTDESADGSTDATDSGDDLEAVTATDEGGPADGRTDGNGPVTGGTDEAGPVRTLDPRIRLKWSGQVLLVVGLVAIVGGVYALVADPVELWHVAALVTPFLVLGLAWVRLRYRRWAFQFRADHLFLQRGVYRNVETVVPYVRIQHVDTSRGPVERLLGLSTLVVYTAGSRGADVAIPGLPAEDAEAMQSRVKELAIEAEGGEGL